ncbi:hypothetical protein AHF37_02160 [Paragonimus kellicotti]|nr:hypothetical protein AHF37_02160 [Paragonimus kellicotti]
MERPSVDFKLTSTPCNKDSLFEHKQLPGSTIEYSCDTGYCTGLCEKTPVSDQDARRTTTFCTSSMDCYHFDECYNERKTLRGKRRVDVISALLEFDRTNYLVQRIIGYVPVLDRINMLCVSRNWNTLNKILPHMFNRYVISSDDKNNKENYTVVPSQSCQKSRVPLADVSCNQVSTPRATLAADAFSVCAHLHACPVCSGVAYYYPSQWPNRLHCQSASCGISVCFNCRREHSPSEKCPVRKSRSVLRMPSPEQEVRPARIRTKLNRLALRRL